MSNKVSTEFLLERDIRIFKLKAAGISNQDIANRFGMSTKAVGAAIRRQTSRMNKDAWMAYPEVVRMELERLDMMQQAIWPMTQPRKIEATQESPEYVEPPDLDAVKTVLSIADRRAKLLGLDINRQDIKMDIGGDVEIRSTLHGAEDHSLERHDPKAEALHLLEVMAASRVLEPAIVAGILEKARAEEAEIVEETTDDEQLALAAGGHDPRGDGREPDAE